MSRKFAIPTYWEYFENQTYDNLGYHEISQIVPNFRYVDESTKILVLQKFHLSCQRSNYQTDQIYCRYGMDTLCLPQAV